MYTFPLNVELNHGKLSIVFDYFLVSDLNEHGDGCIYLKTQDCVRGEPIKRYRVLAGRVLEETLF